MMKMDIFSISPYGHATLPSILILALCSRGMTLNTTEFAFCACDLIGDICDINCCCDSDCSSEQLEAFPCKSNKQESTLISSSWKCSDATHVSELSQFLCIVKENTPYLGDFFPNKPTTKDLPTLNDILSRKYELHNEVSTDVNLDKLKRRDKISLGNKGYVYGQELLSTTETFRTVSLFVPDSVYSGRCDVLQPIQYLKDMSSSCLVLTTNMCAATKLSCLNIKAFAIDSKTRQLLGSPSDEEGIRNISTLVYLIPDHCCFSSSPQCIGKPERCRKNLIVGNIDSLLPVVKSDSFCHNAVVQVNYKFHWNAGRIYSANVSIVLGVVPNSALFEQRFDIQFEHSPPNSSKRNNSSIDTFSQPVYETFDDLVGLVNVNSETEITSSLEKTNLYMYQSEVDGSCVVGKRPVLFGVDKFSGCLYRVPPPSKTVNCTLLREEISNFHAKVLRANLLSRGRKYEAQVVHPNWTLTIRDEEPPFDNATDRPTSDGENGCSDIWDSVQMEIVYTNSGSPFASPSYTLVSATRRYRRVFWDGSTDVIPVTASVKFRFVSMDHFRRHKRTKRYWLPDVPVPQCDEECCWWDLLYPWTSPSVGDGVDPLQDVLESVFLGVALVASTLFLFRDKFSSPSFRRP